MTQRKKYTCRVSQTDSSWTIEIVRRVTAKKTVVTKQQGGFATEAEAQAWGETELKALLKKLNTNKSNKRGAKKASLAQKPAK